MIKVLFVCMGNICRSPTAQGVFQHLLDQKGYSDYIEVDSAGTHAYHIGEPPDPRSQEAAARRGIKMDHLRGRKTRAKDFEDFDYIIAMDQENYENLNTMCPAGLEHKVSLLMQYTSDRPEDEVPDPYFGGPGGFDRVLDMIENASIELLNELNREHRLK